MDPRIHAAAARVAALAAGWEPPSFGHVPDADVAIFLCAVDHKTGYNASHEVDARGPYAGSELMWELGLRKPERLNANTLRSVRGEEVAEWFRIDGETVAAPGRRAALWREL